MCGHKATARGREARSKKICTFGNLELIECVSPPMWSMELILYEEEKNDYESLTIVYFGHKDIFHFFEKASRNG